MKLADAFVEALMALDVRYVFGVSGANIEHLHDAIHRLGGTRLRSVLAKSEDGAAFMADGRARVHRTLGVCCATSGGGMCNLIPGIAEAYTESVPLLAVIGQPPAALEGRSAFQDSSGIGRTVSAEPLFGSVSKFMAKIAHPSEFWPCLQVAISTALAGRQGPSVLLVPRSIWAEEVEPMPVHFVEGIARQSEPQRLSTEAAKDVLLKLRNARRPVLLIGHGVRRSSDPDAVLAFARATGLPTAVTMSARAGFPNDDPQFLGVVGVTGHPSAHAFLRKEADLLLVAGASLNIMTRAPLAADADGAIHLQIIAVNVDPASVARVVAAHGAAEEHPGKPVELPPALVLRADAGAAFRTLLHEWELAPFRVEGLNGYEPRVFVPMDAPPIAPLPRSAAPSSLRQSQALGEIARLLPPDIHVLYDAGNCSSAALHWVELPPGCTSTIALGMGGMGYAVGAAIGAQLGSSPGIRTVALVGDGSFLMKGLEIHTAVDLGLPILYVVFNNNMHGMCVTRQQRFFEGRLESVRYSPVDVATVARGLGDAQSLWVARASSVDELRSALDGWFTGAERPGVLELCIGPEELPPFTPLLPAGARTRPIERRRAE